MAEGQLPRGWGKYESKRYNRHYYFNVYTKESQWVHPSRCAARVPGKGPHEIQCCHLLVKHKCSRRPVSWRQKPITRSREEALYLIKYLRERIQLGQESFSEMAQKYSDCHSAKTGGYLGIFRRGVMEKAFEISAFALKVGEISGPVFTKSGIHLILRTA
ncbi:peptidyl-prolyl cis-trans isomerase NIMA-interacting 1-like [Schistocerca cancellata]|uniref:peptidyl-prolyl cis-trans isomerase NIMA-interacting 1-like n=1 Tax=Schistocerca cancellata TaxID=274614 RepID=UPI0021187E22|nr:peptidyl-prolyl cis-trans isomerase NIMA-interacting 1-like [Schistocerca cancellata]